MIHADVLGERARLSPEKTALVVVPTGRRYTYRELDERAARTAAAWRTLGLGKGDRIGLLAHNRVEFLDFFFAAAKSGVILVPLGTRATVHELAPIVADAELSALAHDARLAQTVAGLRDAARVPRWLALDDPDHARDLPWQPLLAEAAPERRERCAPEDIHCLLYTSGTTGRPKGVMIPHRMIAWNAYNTVLGWGLREDDVSPIFTPLYHAGGLGAFLAPILAAGGTIVLHDRFDTAEVLRTFERERCTVVLGVPTIWKMLAEDPEFATADLSAVRWFISGGAPLPAYLVEVYRRRGIVLRQGYGLTEVGVNCFAMSSEDALARPGSIGRPMMFTEARLVDGARGDVAVGEVGELCLRGPHVCSGYWRNLEATAAALDADGFFHTGDQARRDADGFFYIAGRSKDMFISGGVNVYPAEVEAELLQHPFVADAAVVGVPHETWGEVGVAFVVPRSGTLDERDLQEFLAARLAAYKIPKKLVLVDALPRTPYGKVVKGELRERALAAGSRG